MKLPMDSQKMTSIAAELLKIKRLEYLDSMSSSELAFWLIESFTPERYRAGDNDVVEYACKRLYKIASSHILASQFYEKLWGMHGLEPDKAGFMHQNVVQFRKKHAQSSSL